MLYGIFATPVAFLIDQDGVVAGTVGKGVGQVLALAYAAWSSSDAGVHADYSAHQEINT